MILNETTVVAVQSLPVAAFREHLRLGSGFSDDGDETPVLETYLRAAISAVEAQTGKALLTREFSWVLSKWRMPSTQGLPIAPVTAITSVTLGDAVGGTTVVDPSLYHLVEDQHRPAIASIAGAFPSVPSHGQVEIAFEAGFGAAWADVPTTLAQAVMMLAALYFDHRHGIAPRQDAIPMGIQALIAPHRSVRLGGGA